MEIKEIVGIFMAYVEDVRKNSRRTVSKSVLREDDKAGKRKISMLILKLRKKLFWRLRKRSKSQLIQMNLQKINKVFGICSNKKCNLSLAKAA